MATYPDPLLVSMIESGTVKKITDPKRALVIRPMWETGKPMHVCIIFIIYSYHITYVYT